MDLFKIASGIKPFFRQLGSLQAIYDEFARNSHLDPIKSKITKVEYVKLIYILHDLLNENVSPEQTNEKLNNLFMFAIVEFGYNEITVSCDYCGGNGTQECSECDGSGKEECSECDGNGKEECSECEGSGKVEGDDGEEDECSECDGTGKTPCNNCDGDGEFACNICDGEGDYTCDECGGDGEVTNSDFLEYEISEFVSTNNELKEYLVKTIKKKKELKQKIRDFEGTFEINGYSEEQGSGYSDSVDHDYEQKDFVLYVKKLKEDNLGYLNKRLASSIEPDMEQFT